MVASLAMAPVISPAAFAAVALTPEVNETSPNAAYYAAIDTDTRTTGTKPAPPTAVVLGCGWGKSIWASEGILEVPGATDHDWRALECTRLKGFPRTAPQRTTPGTVICRSWIQQLCPKVLIGHACRSITETGLEETREAARAAVSLIHTFVDSSARLLILQCTSHLPRSPEWTDLTHFLVQAECDWETVELSALQVGVPYNRKMTYIT